MLLSLMWAVNMTKLVDLFQVTFALSLRLMDIRDEGLENGTITLTWLIK